ncbi:MAG: MauE/DoxX family redox-associated membrane protein [Bacillota bacterium]
MDAPQQAQPTDLLPGARGTGSSAFALMRCLVAAILLFAAVQKWRELAAMPPSQWYAVGRVPLLLTQIGGEALLAIWLASGLRPRLAWVVTALAFTGFLIISLWKTARGEVSCGCFGRLVVHPGYTAGLDAAILAGWYGVRRHAWRQQGHGMSAYWIAGMLSLVVGGTLTAVWLNRPVFANLSNAAQLPAAGDVVYFDASDWVGKPMPLRVHIDIGDRLSRGRWILVLHNSQCRRCRQVVPEYRQLAAQWTGRSNAPGIALVDVVPDASQADSEAPGRTSVLLGHITSSQKWFIITPAVLALENGTVLAVNSEESAAQWAASVFKAP